MDLALRSLSVLDHEPELGRLITQGRRAELAAFRARWWHVALCVETSLSLSFGLFPRLAR